jgi:porphobilinogen synthase
MYPDTRLRRLRQNRLFRDLVRETALSPADFIMPLFVRHGSAERRPIASMPGQFQFSIDQVGREIDEIVSLGIPAVILFGIPEHKDAAGSDACSDDGIVQEAVRAIKAQSSDVLVITDVCLCEFTDHGHCGVVTGEGAEADVDNDATLKILACEALSHAEAGADMIAPSGMMDGMVSMLRTALDANGFSNLPIMSYAAKFASAFYGPFREAAESAPRFGDRRSYQMDPANGREAMREIDLDVSEGADILMVKPALAFLDIVHEAKRRYPEIPLAASSTSRSKCSRASNAPGPT